MKIVIQTDFALGMKIDGRGHVKGEMSLRAMDFRRAMHLEAEGTYLTFKSGIYKQSAGLAMGSPASGDTANLYLCTLEDLALGPVRASGALLFYCRYIDDALALSVMEEADVVAECITGLDPSGALKLTTPGAAPQVDYLDLVLFVSPGKVVYRCHQKSLNRYLYIPFHSHQPQALQCGWIRAEALRQCGRLLRAQAHIHPAASCERLPEAPHLQSLACRATQRP
jgi:hypothetical protein